MTRKKEVDKGWICPNCYVKMHRVLYTALTAV